MILPTRGIPRAPRLPGRYRPAGRRIAFGLAAVVMGLVVWDFARYWFNYWWGRMR